MNYYNEFDPRAAAWLRELMRRGLIPPGDVDERSIVEVRAADLVGYTQCHFFAGIGGWSYALQLAGWPADRPVWTGSCPCQPFSNAGKQQGEADERHVWPEFHRLIKECRPAVCFGEQVASKLGRAWLSGVRSDLEGIAYDVGAADLPACCVGQKSHPLIQEAQRWAITMADQLDLGGEERLARQFRDFASYLDGILIGPPHIRQRVWWVADTADSRWPIDGHGGEPGKRGTLHPADSGSTQRLAITNGGDFSSQREQRGGEHGQQQDNCRSCGGFANTGSEQGGERHDLDLFRGRAEESEQTGLGSGSDGMVQSFQSRLEGLSGHGDNGNESRWLAENQNGSIATASTVDHWSDFYLQPCRDGKARRVGSRVRVLAAGIPGRVGILRGFGNAIVPEVAAVFIQSYLEARRMIHGNVH